MPAQPASDARFAPREGNLAPALVDLALLDRKGFDQRFRGTNVRRARWSGFLRNVMIVATGAGILGGGVMSCIASGFMAGLKTIDYLQSRFADRPNTAPSV